MNKGHSRRAALKMIGVGSLATAYACGGGASSPTAPSRRTTIPFPADGALLGSGVVFDLAEFLQRCAPIRRLGVDAIDGPGAQRVLEAFYLNIVPPEVPPVPGEGDPVDVANTIAVTTATARVLQLTASNYFAPPVFRGNSLPAFGGATTFLVFTHKPELGADGVETIVGREGVSGSVGRIDVHYGNREAATERDVDLFRHATARGILGPGLSSTGGVLDPSDGVVNAKDIEYAKIVYRSAIGQTQ